MSMSMSNYPSIEDGINAELILRMQAARALVFEKQARKMLEDQPLFSSEWSFLLDLARDPQALEYDKLRKLRGQENGARAADNEPTGPISTRDVARLKETRVKITAKRLSDMDPWDYSFLRAKL
eukprot:ANDGO_06506.mRNA.1 hypothetical protein